VKPCAYYNEFDPFAAQWLRNLIAAGHIAPGEVDERSITEVRPDDLRGFTQCHFFAGIGGWSYALRLAGVPDDAAVWTGSCPCQPFSAAGKQRGSDDERHLWPAFFDLIRQCRPGTVFGEQVAGAAGYAWWDHVAADLEGEGYAAAAADIGAHSVGAPHLRQRLYWVAHADSGRLGQRSERDSHAAQPEQQASLGHDPDRCGQLRDLGHTAVPGPQGRDEPGQRADAQLKAIERTGAAGDWVGRVGDSASGGHQSRSGIAGVPAEESGNVAVSIGSASGRLDAWADLEWLQCSDGKARPTQPGLFPLAHGVSGRVGRLRAYGNAIVPQVAAAFVRAAA